MDLLHFNSTDAFYCLLLITDVLTVLTTWNCHLRLRGTASSGFSQLILRKHLSKSINYFLNSHLVLLCALKLVENNRRELFLGDRWSFFRQARDLVQLAKVFIELTCIDVVLRRVSKSFCERLFIRTPLQCFHQFLPSSRTPKNSPLTASFDTPPPIFQLEVDWISLRVSRIM